MQLILNCFPTCGVDEPALRSLLPGGVADVAAAHVGRVGRVGHDGAHVALLEGGAAGGLNLQEMVHLNLWGPAYI